MLKKKNNNYDFILDFYRDFEFTIIKSDSSLKNIEFYNCSFKNCDFSNSSFFECRFEECNFIESNLSLLKIPSSQFIDCNFNNSKMLAIDWTQAENILEPVFNNCNLEGSVFFGLKLKNLTMMNCKSSECNFEEACLPQSKFNNTNFLNARFNKTDLSFCDFTEAINYNINPNFNKIKKAKFSLPEILTLLQCFDILIK